MLYAVENPEGLGVLILHGSTPFPEGAVYPVEQGLEALPAHHMKIEGGEVVELDQAEKDQADQDIVDLPTAKADKINAIDAKTAGFINAGVDVGGETYSTSLTAKMNFMAMRDIACDVQGTNLPAEQLALVQTVANTDESQIELFADEDDAATKIGAVIAFYYGYISAINALRAGGAVIKATVAACTTVAEVFAIEDDR